MIDKELPEPVGIVISDNGYRAVRWAVQAKILTELYTADQLREEVAKAHQSGRYALWTEMVPTLGTRVHKKSGSQWQGRIIGFYRTELTPDGVCVESEFHPGSVQIYPRNALEVIE